MASNRPGETYFMNQAPDNRPIQNEPMPPNARISDAACSGFFGMNLKGLPWVDTPYGAEMALGLMVLTTALLTFPRTDRDSQLSRLAVEKGTA